ncbi:conserved domain protein [Ruminococcus albus 8]|uniref:Conserved domain protein n=1 Tax=Ruminococcus albus 8 TaxID=246199 RepID=E9SCE4_RUMAL|nr:conserved domain protein [Ruminococcus albus 8]
MTETIKNNIFYLTDICLKTPKFCNSRPKLCNSRQKRASCENCGIMCTIKECGKDK